jgi:hypothetical protein
MDLKYIVYKDYYNIEYMHFWGGNLDLAIHKEEWEKLVDACYPVHLEPISAGYISDTHVGGICHGYSCSMNIKARDEDTQMFRDIIKDMRQKVME